MSKLTFVGNSDRGAYAITQEQIDYYHALLIEHGADPVDVPGLTQEVAGIVVVKSGRFIAADGVPVEVAVLTCVCDDHKQDYRAMIDGQILPGGLDDKELALKWFVGAMSEQKDHPLHDLYTDTDVDNDAEVIKLMEAITVFLENEQK